MEPKKTGISLVDLQTYLAMGLRHFRLMVLLMCFACIGGLAYYIFKRPIYHTRSLVHIEVQDRQFDSDEIYRDSEVNYVLRQLVSPHITEKVMQEFGIDASHVEIERKYVRKLRWGFNSEGNLEIRTWATSPELAKNVVPTALEVYYRYRDERRADIRNRTIEVYTEEMARMLEDMAAYNDKEQAFRVQTRLAEVQAEFERLKMVPDELQLVNKRLMDLEKGRDALRDQSLDIVQRLSIIDTINPGLTLKKGETIHTSLAPAAQGTEGTPFAPQMKIVVNPSMKEDVLNNWTNVHKQIDRLELQREDLVQRGYLPMHQKVAAVDRELGELKQELAAKLSAAEERLEWEYAKLEFQKNDLERKMPLNREAMHQYETIMWEFEQLGIGEFPWKAKYLEMAQKIAELEYAAETPNRTLLQFMGILEASRYAVSPARGKLMVASLALGFALCIGFVFVIEYLDHSITRVDKAEEALGMRGLGIVPQLPATLTDVNEIPLLTDGEAAETGHERNSIRETFRVIRANIMESREFEGDRQVIMVTSSIPKEGKSVVSSNLALSFASVGEKTLLIDADIRRRSLSRTFNRGSGRGLSDVLKNYTTLDEACVLTDHDYMHLLPAGTLTSQAPELLAGTVFTQLMQELRQRYQRIILDTPPVLGLSEACEVLRCVDGVLLVIWSAYTPMHQVKDATNLLRGNGAKFFGFVLNRLDLSGAKNYYQYYYYSDYYYRSYSS